MILLIDTSDFNNLRLVLLHDSTVKEYSAAVAFNENYKTSQFLEKFLKHNKVSVKQLSKIIVCSGPGSFTGIRVGISLAQALGFALHIPVIAVPKNKLPEDMRKLGKIKGGKTLAIHYGQKPHVTKAKK